MTESTVKTNKIHKPLLFKTRRGQKNFFSYLMISPQLIGFFVFTLYPILWVISKAFYYYVGIPDTQQFVGFDNFVRLFKTDAGYWQAWITTLQYAVYKLPIELPLALVLAVFLNRKIKGTGFFRSIYFMPNIISAAIVGLILGNMFDYFGFINGILAKLGLITEGFDWFATKGRAMTTLVLGSIWQCFGVNVLYFLAGLQNIDEELYEAAYLDGASSLRTFWSITLPLMAPILQIVILLAINGSLQVNDYVIVMTNGAPGGQTNTIMSYLTKKFMPGFADELTINIGYGSSVYLVTSFITCIIAIVYSKLSNKLSDMY